LPAAVRQHDGAVVDTHESMGEGVVEDGMARAVAPPRLDRVVIRPRTVADPHEQLTEKQVGRGLGA